MGKDLYQVLNVSTKANAEEIKKAFRKLAMRYHPDKNHDLFSVEKFTAIQEAYTILSDTKKRAAYDYDRYLLNPKRAAYVVTTAADVLQLALRMENDTARLDPFRIDRDLLYFQLVDILSEDNIRLLRESNDEHLTRQFITALKKSLGPLPFLKMNLILAKLSVVAGADTTLVKQLKEFKRKSQYEHQWNRSKIFIAFIIAVIICALMYAAVR